MKIQVIVPILQVTSIEKAITFYCSVLGFSKEFEYGEPSFYAGVKRNDFVIHLNSSKENTARCGLGNVYVFCDEVDKYYEEVRAKGAAITSRLKDLPYGMRDFQLKDPDENLLNFGCSL